MMKRCSTCRETKPFDMFGRNKRMDDGYAYRCKVCVNSNAKIYRELNRGYYSEYFKTYRESNPEKISAKRARHRAMKRNAIPKFLCNCMVEKKRLQDTYKLRQLISDATGIEHHVDHMWPLSKGGPHWSGNLQILTATENLSKSDKVCKTLKKNIKASLEIARKEYDNDEDHSRRVD